MKKASRLNVVIALAALSTLNPSNSFAGLADPLITYQGRLNDGAGPANGLYDLSFTLFNAAGGQFGAFTTNGVPVNNGLFTVNLDLGPGATAFPGEDRYLEISARPNGAAAFTTLSPRQRITPAPYAVTASNLSGVLGSTALSGFYTSPVIFNNMNDSFAGNGGSLTNLSAGALKGTIPDTSLSPNAARRDQGNAFTGVNWFGGNVGVGISNPLHMLHVGSSAGAAINGAPNKIVVENNSSTSGRAAVLALAGPSSGNRVEVQLEADVNQNHGIFGTTSNHELEMRVNNNQIMTLATSMNVGIGTTTPTSKLDVNGTIKASAFNGPLTGDVTGNAATATSAASFTGTLNGEVTGTQGATTVAKVGGQTAANVAAGANAANAASSDNTSGTIVKRDANGNFSAGTVTATAFSGSGAGLTALNPANLSGSLTTGQLPSSVVYNNSSGVTLSGTFSGNGSGLTGISGAISWVTVSGASVQAQPNKGYIVTDPAQVTIGLPATAVAGDVVRIFGLGAGGWRTEPCGAAWTPHAIQGNWIAVASSSDGTKLAAANGDGQVYTSTDSGLSWIQRSASPSGVRSIACSSDGARLVALTISGFVYISTDSGVNWALQPNAGQKIWTQVACSADGIKLAAGTSGGPVYTSIDGGATWVARPIGGYIFSVASSADGNRLVAADAAAGNGRIYTSINGGASWTATGPSLFWQSVACSSDGTKIVAVTANSPSGPGQIYTSTDSGASWTLRSPAAYWRAVASSTDGSKLVAVSGSASSGGQIYASPDGGATWCAEESLRNWSAVAVSADGTKRVALEQNGYIYTSTASVGLPGSMADFVCLGNGVWVPISQSAVNGNFTVGGFPIVSPGTVSPAAGSTLVPTTGFMKLTAASPVTLNATTAISSGTVPGMTLILEGTSDANTVTIPDNANTRLSSAHVLGANDTLTLLWDGSAWVETAFANN